MSSSSGSEKGERNGTRGAGGRQGEELASKTLVIQAKRFYLDVKQNDRGRFIKFAEVAGGGRKSRLFMSMRTSKTFKDHLDKFVERVADLGESDDKAEPALIHSETIFNDKRRYFLDLRENNRGAFLRITQSDLQSRDRFSIALPAQGVELLRDALAELLNEYGEEDPEVELPESRYLRIDNKTFYFDPEHNARGDFFKISEVRPMYNVRNSIAVSSRALPQFIQILSELNEGLQKLRGPNNSVAAIEEDKVPQKEPEEVVAPAPPVNNNGNNSPST